MAGNLIADDIGAEDDAEVTQQEVQDDRFCDPETESANPDDSNFCSGPWMDSPPSVPDGVSVYCTRNIPEECYVNSDEDTSTGDFCDPETASTDPMNSNYCNGPWEGPPPSVPEGADVLCLRRTIGGEIVDPPHCYISFRRGVS